MISKTTMRLTDKIYVAGHLGLVGSALMRKLRSDGFTNVITRTHAELDLCDQLATQIFLDMERPDYVFLVAARVGGIMANIEYPADFLRINLLIEASVIDAAYRSGVKKLLFVGSSCIYPRNAPQPMKEEYLMTGPLEPTNAAYSIAKIAGVMMCQAYRAQHDFNAIAIMPSNVYGPEDNFDLLTSHVLPALLRKCYNAKTEGRSMEVWGSGRTRREFLYSDDLADAMVFLMQHYDDGEIVNVGVGRDVSVRELVSVIQTVVGFDGNIIFDASKPEGMPKRLLDVSRLSELGWRTKHSLTDGIQQTFQWFVENIANEKKKLIL